MRLAQLASVFFAGLSCAVLAWSAYQVDRSHALFTTVLILALAGFLHVMVTLVWVRTTRPNRILGFMVGPIDFGFVVLLTLTTGVPHSVPGSRPAANEVWAFGFYGLAIAGALIIIAALCRWPLSRMTERRST
jgi:hypothetical protein